MRSGPRCSKIADWLRRARLSAYAGPLLLGKTGLISRSFAELTDPDLEDLDREAINTSDRRWRWRCSARSRSGGGWQPAGHKAVRQERRGDQDRMAKKLWRLQKQGTKQRGLAMNIARLDRGLQPSRVRAAWEGAYLGSVSCVRPAPKL